MCRVHQVESDCWLYVSCPPGRVWLLVVCVVSTRWSLTGSTSPWFWTVCFCGCSRWPAWAAHVASCCRRLCCTIRPHPSTGSSPGWLAPTSTPWQTRTVRYELQYHRNGNSEDHPTRTTTEKHVTGTTFEFWELCKGQHLRTTRQGQHLRITWQDRDNIWEPRDRDSIWEPRDRATSENHVTEGQHLRTTWQGNIWEPRDRGTTSENHVTGQHLRSTWQE